MQKTLKVNYKLLPFLTKPQPIKVAYGGRGSGKSIGVCDMAIMKMESQKIDIYCLREFQESIEDSIHRTLSMSINRLGLEGWDVQEKKITSPFGNRTTYKGAARNATSIQGAENYLLSIFSEAHTASQESIDRLLPTILRKPGAQCWFEANPQSSGDPFSERFINPYKDIIDKQGYYEDDLHYIVSVNWRDNPWWNEEQERLRNWDFENLSRAKYDWIWEGAFCDTVPAAIIEADWFDACVDAHIKLGFEPKGQEKMAYDPADCGDAKAIAYIHGSVLIGCSSTTEGLIDTATDWALGKCNQLKPDVFLWDCDGIGAGLKDQVLKALNGKKIKPVMFKGSMAAQDDEQWTYSELEDIEPEDRFSNQRAQCYWRLRERMIKTYKAVVLKQYCDPDELISFSSSIAELKGLRSELCRIPRKPNSAGRIQLVSKADMLKPPYRLKSPNLADAVMMLMKTVDMYESDDDYYEPVRRGTWA